MGKNTFWSIITIIGIELIVWHLFLPAIIANNSIGATVFLSVFSCAGLWLLYEIYITLDE